ncbi:MAG: hypothetical protein ACR2GD_11645 [Pyrinomonadaceae bacterium]
MILSILGIFFLTIGLFSPESLVSTIVGGIVSLGLTHAVKNAVGLQGAGAAILAFVVSLVVAIAAYILSTVMSGGQISWEMIPQGAAQIFTLATLAYKIFMADDSSAPNYGNR